MQAFDWPLCYSVQWRQYGPPRAGVGAHYDIIVIATPLS